MRSSLLARTWPWIGLWACVSLVYASIYPWVSFFHLRGVRPLPAPSAHGFYLLFAAPAMLAFATTLSIWRNRYNSAYASGSSIFKPGKGPIAAGVGALLLGIIVLDIVGNWRAAPYWPGVIGGIAVLPALFLAALKCGRIAVESAHAWARNQPAGRRVEAEKRIVLVEAPWRRPPRNSYRSVSTANEVVYRKPLGTRIAGLVIFLFLLGLCAVTLYFAACCFSILYNPEPTFGPPAGVIFLTGAILCGLGSLYLLLASGPQELRVSPSDKTYTLRAPTPLPKSLATRLGRTMRISNGELGVPWRMVKRSGPCSDMAGVALQATVAGEATYYAVWLYWNKDEILPMRLAWSGREDAAHWLLGEASRDLQVPILPEQPAVRR